MEKIIIPEQMLPSDGRFGSGPSKIRSKQIDVLCAAGRSLMGTSHRQQPVKNLVASIKSGLSQLFELPEGYEIALGNGGATAFWDIACACLINRKAAFGVYGSFSKKFASSAQSAPFLDEPAIYSAEPGSYCLPEPTEEADAYCWAHNETSTGVMTPVKRIEDVDEDALMLIDATSAAGAAEVDIEQTDAYYFSPQKAFGSDGGLWIAVLSPRAIARAKAIESTADLPGARRWVPPFLSLTAAVENSRKNQTLNTPAIATLILMDEQIKQLNANGGLKASAARCAQSAQTVYDWAENCSYAQPFVQDKAARSTVVVTVDIDDSISANAILSVLRDNGIVDISGYRKLGRNQLRVGVFPSVEPDDVKALTNCIDYAVEKIKAAN